MEWGGKSGGLVARSRGRERGEQPLRRRSQIRVGELTTDFWRHGGRAVAARRLDNFWAGQHWPKKGKKFLWGFFSNSMQMAGVPAQRHEIEMEKTRKEDRPSGLGSRNVVAWVGTGVRHLVKVETLVRLPGRISMAPPLIATYPFRILHLVCKRGCSRGILVELE